MSHQDSIGEVLHAVKVAQRWVEEAQANPSGYTEAQNQLNFAEELISNVQLNAQNGNIEDRHQLQQATDLLRMLQETQQSNTK